MSTKNYLGEDGLSELITNCNKELLKKQDLLNLYTESSTKATIDAGDITLSAGADINIIADSKLSVGGAKTYINGDSIDISAPSISIVCDSGITSFNHDVLTILEEKAYYKNEELATLHDLEDYQLQLEEGLSAKQDSLKYYYETETGEVQIYPNTDLLIIPKTTCTISAPDGINLGNAVEIDPDKAFYNGYELATQLDISTKQDILTAGTGIAITDSTISCTYSDDIDSLKETVSANTGDIKDLSNSLDDTNKNVSALLGSIDDAELDIVNLENSIASLEDSKQDKLTAGTGIDITNNTISCTLDTTVFEIVESLPTSNIDTNKIYVIPAEHTEESNLYAEYIYVNNAWEKLGEFKADTDLSNYYTKSETNALLDEKANSKEVYTKDEIDTLVYDKDYIDEVTNNIQTELNSKLDELKYYSERDGSEAKGIVSLTAKNISIDCNDQDSDGKLHIEADDVTIDSSTLSLNGNSIDILGDMTAEGNVIISGSVYINRGEVITTNDDIIYSTAVQLVVLVGALPSNPDSTTLYLIPE